MSRPVLVFTPPTAPSKAIDGPRLIAELSTMRGRLTPDFQVIADALAYCIVGIDHLLMHVHDEEVETN